MNEFYVQPATQQILGGMQTALQGFEQKQAREQERAILQEGAQLLQSGDPSAVAEWNLRNPGYSQQFIQAANIQDNLTQKPLIDSAKEVLSGNRGAKEVIEERLFEVESKGGSAENLRAMYDRGDDNEMQRYFENTLALYSPNAYKSYMSTRSKDASGLPAAVQETEWFLKQSPEVQKQHLKVKRKTDPSLAEKLQFELDKAEGVTTAKGEAAQKLTDEQIAKKQASDFNVYQVAMDGVIDALGGTSGGPISGRIPAVTSGAQIADQATKILLPAIKSIVRKPGEGNFTDADQRALEAMLPNRSMTPEAQRVALENIDRFVRASLGQSDFEEVGYADSLQGVDLEAYEWATQNPNDHRSAQILEKLGVK